MYAHVRHSGNARRLLNYNELKVANGKAELILARNFLQRTGSLSVEDKLSRFQSLNELNSRSQTNMIHIVLATSRWSVFYPSQWSEVSDRYLKGIGLGDQPYLVYRHDDTIHPHVHIVANIIRPDGLRINTFANVRSQSEKLRQQLHREYEYELKSPKPSKRSYGMDENPRVLTYGKTGVSAAMREILDFVVEKYQFTSLEEYNAILRGYNIWAHHVHAEIDVRRKGLVYQALDQKGQAIGKPVPSSFFESKPTWETLIRRFVENHLHAQEKNRDLINRLKWVHHIASADLHQYAHGLSRENIRIVIVPGKTADSDTLVYVDHRAKLALRDDRLDNNLPSARFRPKLSQLMETHDWKMVIPQNLSELLKERSELAPSINEIELKKKLVPQIRHRL